MKLLSLLFFLCSGSLLLGQSADPVRATKFAPEKGPIAAESTPPAYPIQGTFLDFYRNLTPELWALEFQYMKAVDIDTVVILSVGHLQPNPKDPRGYSLAPDGFLYPSNYLSQPLRPANDVIDLILSLADTAGMHVYIGSLQTATDWSDETEFTALQYWNQQVASEILHRYGQHPSLKGWYFPQEIWMNWVKYYGGPNYNASAYYGTTLMRKWVARMKSLDPTKLTTAAVVVKETGDGAMPGMSAAELQHWMTSFLQATKIDLLMPQDGAGAEAGAPGIDDLPNYFAAMAAATQAANTNTALWSTTETFSYVPGVSSEQYPPADASRIQQQVSAVRPYVTGYIGWIFGDDMSQQATYYPVEASELNRRYQYLFAQGTRPNYDVIPLQSYWYSSPPDSQYPDSGATPKLSDRTGGGYNGYSLTSWVGFSNPDPDDATLQITGDLGSIRTISAARALTMSWIPSGILHPDQIEVDYSQDGLNWAPFGSANSFPSDTQNFSVMWGEVDASASARYVRWTFTYKQWLMLAELEVIGPQ